MCKSSKAKFKKVHNKFLRVRKEGDWLDMPSKAHELYCITWIQLFANLCVRHYVCLQQIKDAQQRIRRHLCIWRESSKSQFFNLSVQQVKYTRIRQQRLQAGDSHVGLSPLVCTRDFIITVGLCNDLLLTGSQNGHQRLRLTGICGCQWPVTTLGMNSKWGQTEALHQDTMEREGPLGHHVTAARWLQQ